MKPYPTEWPETRPPTACERCGNPIKVKWTSGGGQKYYHHPLNNVQIKYCPNCDRKLSTASVVSVVREVWGYE